MKKSIDNNIELQKFKDEFESNLKIYEGKPGGGKSFSAKSEINQLSLMEDINIYVIDSHKEYKKLDRENVNINNDIENIFEILDDIYEKSGVLTVNQKTIVYIENFELYCRGREKQIKFLDYAEKLKHHGISFVLIVQDLEFMDRLIRNMYLLYCGEHYEFNRD
ncbi:helicase HerA domain-containing protein [Clostridium saccharoperbutylacetonicum]|uniref:helicase HerA domain-containing protein n=1 Tax=Clostridium saccharoperbutylacetonicum TaxID=36745 RepID=UPI0039ECBFC8